jgi:hypothetical protein
MEPSAIEVVNYLVEDALIPLCRTIGSCIGAGLNSFSVELSAHLNFTEKLTILGFFCIVSIFCVFCYFFNKKHNRNNDERFENQVSQREMNTYFLTDDEN